MTDSLSLDERVREVLACPHCHGELAFRDAGHECQSCERRYAETGSGQLDLRLTDEKLHRTETVLSPGYDRPSYAGFDHSVFGRLDPADGELVDVALPERVTRELVSQFPRPESDDALVLDLGCGTGVHRGICERLGYTWVGIDIDSDGATILADGHALPFQDDSFKFAIAIAGLLNEVAYPFVVAEEIHRVLEPDATLIGSVAFLEEWYYRGHNFYNYSPSGLYALLDSSGFTVERIAPYDIETGVPSIGWEGPVPQARQLFPDLPESVSRAIVAPLYLLHRGFYRVKAHYSPEAAAEIELRRALRLAGQLCFIATK